MSRACLEGFGADEGLEALHKVALLLLLLLFHLGLLLLLALHAQPGRPLHCIRVLLKGREGVRGGPVEAAGGGVDEAGGGHGVPKQPKLGLARLSHCEQGQSCDHKAWRAPAAPRS